MSLLRPLSIFLRNALVKQHPYFSCCASCGEIKTPLGKRLCTSLAVSEPVDAVIPAGDAPEALLVTTVELLRRSCPWLRQIVLLTSETALPALTAALSGLSYCALTERAFLETLTDGAASPLNAGLLLVLPGAAPQQSRLPHDFFTPNGLPLIRLLQPGTVQGLAWRNFPLADAIRPLSGSLLREFMHSAEAPAAALPCTALWGLASLWALDAARAIPAKA